MKKIVSLALVLVMVVAMFAGCAASATDQEKLVGTWKGELDMTEAMKESVGEMAADFELKDFKYTVIYTFTAEGTYKVEADKASVEQAFQVLGDSLSAYLEQSMEAEAAAAGMTVDDMMAVLGMSMDEFVDAMLEMIVSEEVIEAALEEEKREGKFVAKDGKLHLSEALDQEISESVYDTYTLDGDVLTLTGCVGADEDQAEIADIVYPVVLKKAA